MDLSSAIDKDMKVLIADDLNSARAVLHKRLAEIGLCNVIEAADGKETLEKLLAEQDVQLIICDWQMPHLEGVQVAEQLQAVDRYRLVPFILATSKDAWEDVAQATAVGVWGYIVKPVTAENLAQEIEAVFAARAEVIAEGQGS